MLKNYFIIAWRNLWKHKLTSIINVIGLSLGVACLLVIFNFVRYQWSFDRTYSFSDRTFRVVEEEHFQESVSYHNTTAYPLADALRSEFPQLEFVTQTHGPVSGIVNTTKPGADLFEEDQMLFVDSIYLEVFDAKWLEGDKKSAFKDPKSIVITKTLAQKYFTETIEKRQTVVGKMLNIKVPGEFTETFKVTGLVNDPPPNVTFRYTLLLPYQYYQLVDTYATTNWSGNYQGTTFVTLRSGQKAGDIESLLPSFKSKYLSPEDDARKNYFLQPLTEVHTTSKFGAAPGSYVLPGKYLVGLVLLTLLIMTIAIANFISLSTAQAINRMKEVGVRRAIGSTRFQLIIQFLFETFMVSLLAVVLALLITSNVLSILNRLLISIDLQLSFNDSTWWTALALVLLVPLVAGLYPAVMASKIDVPIRSTTTQKAPLKKSLLVLQFAICQVLVAATLVVAWQMKYLSKKELGFDQDEIVNVPIPEFNPDRLEAFKFRLKQNPYIEQVSFASGVPTSHDLRLGTTFRLQGTDNHQSIPAEMKVVDQEYIDTYGLHVIAGEGITLMQEDGHFNGFVVNETLVEALGLSPEEAIGKQLVINEGQAPIKGVVADFHNSSLKEEISPCLLFNWYPDFLWDAGIKITAGSNTSVLAYIKQSWEEFFPLSVYRFKFLKEYLNDIYGLEQLVLLFITVAAVLAIVLGCMGLYGLMAFSAVQRTKEIGLRKVMGATIADILIILSSEYIRLLGLSFIIAAPISWHLSNYWLDGFTYRIEIGIWVFLATFMAVLIVAAIAVSWRLWKVAVTNPVLSIRNEQ